MRTAEQVAVKEIELLSEKQGIKLSNYTISDLDETKENFSEIIRHRDVEIAILLGKILGDWVFLNPEDKYAIEQYFLEKINCLIDELRNETEKVKK